MVHSLEEREPRIPEPALVRSAVISVTSIVAIVFNINLDLGWLDSVLVIYAALAPVIAGYLIRRKVVPEKIATFREQRALFTEPPTKAA